MSLGAKLPLLENCCSRVSLGAVWIAAKIICKEYRFLTEMDLARSVGYN